MNLLTKILLISAIITLLFAVLTSARISTENPSEKKAAELHIRQMAHNFLLANGDSTSRILPVKQLSDMKFIVRFAKPFSFAPDSLVNVVERMLAKGDFQQDHLITVEEIKTSDIVYGFSTEALKKGEVACLGRKMPEGIYQLVVEKKGVNENGITKYLYPTLSASMLSLLLFMVVKPFSRRKRVGNSLSQVFKIGKYSFYPQENRLIYDGLPIVLTLKECKLLQIFCNNVNGLIERNQLLKEGWEDEGVITTRSLDMHVSKLRKKLVLDENVSITNIHGRGYVLKT